MPWLEPGCARCSRSDGSSHGPPAMREHRASEGWPDTLPAMLGLQFVARRRGTVAAVVDRRTAAGVPSVLGRSAKAGFGSHRHRQELAVVAHRARRFGLLGSQPSGGQYRAQSATEAGGDALVGPGFGCGVGRDQRSLGRASGELGRPASRFRLRVRLGLVPRVCAWSIPLGRDGCRMLLEPASIGSRTNSGSQHEYLEPL